MNKEFFENLLSNLNNPSRVTGAIIDGTYAKIFSAENTNDTLDWFNINSGAIEEALLKEDLSWCYVFETVPLGWPFIYMYIGKNVTEDTVKEWINEEFDNLPEDLQLFFETCPYSSIDEDTYNNGITELEKNATKYADCVFKVYEP